MTVHPWRQWKMRTTTLAHPPGFVCGRRDGERRGGGEERRTSWNQHSKAIVSCRHFKNHILETMMALEWKSMKKKHAFGVRVAVARWDFLRLWRETPSSSGICNLLTLLYFHYFAFPNQKQKHNPSSQEVTSFYRILKLRHRTIPTGTDRDAFSTRRRENTNTTK